MTPCRPGVMLLACRPGWDYCWVAAPRASQTWHSPRSIRRAAKANNRCQLESVPKTHTHLHIYEYYCVRCFWHLFHRCVVRACLFVCVCVSDSGGDVRVGRGGVGRAAPPAHHHHRRRPRLPRQQPAQRHRSSWRCCRRNICRWWTSHQPPLSHRPAA